MVRLALAVLLVAGLIASIAFVAASLRKSLVAVGEDDGAKPMQRAAYFVLVALMLYVSLAGIFA